MKNKIKLVSICLVIVLALCACFFACNDDDKPTPEEERAEAVDSVQNAFMSGVVDGWSGNLDDDTLVTRKDAGDYIVTLGWTRMICSVISDSDLQTAKINALATALASQNGRTLLKDFEKNAELLIPLLKEVGFTPTDISSLVYDLMCAMASKGANTIADIQAKLVSIRERMKRNGASNEVMDNVEKNLVTVTVAKSAFAPTATEKEQMLAAFSKAQNAMNQLVSFAYNMSVNAITDELYGKLFDDSGALGEITQSELSTLVDTLLTNVRNLKAALTDEEVKNLNAALNLVIEKFDKDTVSSAIYAQIVTYAKYAYMIVDIIPAVCDIITSSGDLLTDEGFIADFLAVSQNPNKLDTATTRINQTILVARAVLKMTESDKFGEEQIKAFIRSIGNQGAADYKKAVPVFLLDLMFNFSSLYDSISKEADVWNVAHEQFMTQEALGTQISFLLFFDGNFDKFKETYYKYTKGEASLSDVQRIFNLCSFDSFVDVSAPSFPTSGDAQSVKSWYNYYVTTGVNAVNEKISQCLCDNVIPDLEAFVEDYFAENSSMKAAIEQIAGWDIVKDADLSEEVIKSDYLPTLLQSRVLGTTLLFMF